MLNLLYVTWTGIDQSDINRLRGLLLRLRQQGFETNRLHNSFNKFVNRHGLIVEKNGAALQEMRLAIQA